MSIELKVKVRVEIDYRLHPDYADEIHDEIRQAVDTRAGLYPDVSFEVVRAD